MTRNADQMSRMPRATAPSAVIQEEEEVEEEEEEEEVGRDFFNLFNVRGGPGKRRGKWSKNDAEFNFKVNRALSKETRNLNESLFVATSWSNQI